MKPKKMKQIDVDLLRLAQKFQAAEGSAESMLIDRRMRDDKNLPGWLRLGAFLMDARKDEVVSSSAGASDFLLMVQRLALNTCLDILTGNAEAETDFSKIKAFRPLAADLAGEELGRHKGHISGGETMKRLKAAHTKHLTTAVVDILKNPKTSDWKDPDIARWLMEPGKAYHERKGKTPLGHKTMTTRVKEIRAAYKASI